MLRSNAIEGYTQVSRVGEQVINCFVDPYEFGVLPASFTDAELEGKAFSEDGFVGSPRTAMRMLVLLQRPLNTSRTLSSGHRRRA